MRSYRVFGELVDRVPLTWEEQLMGGRKEIALLPSDVIAQAPLVLINLHAKTGDDSGSLIGRIFLFIRL